MSMDEFVTWQAFLRRHPRGLRWDNWAQASLAQLVDATRPRKPGTTLPKFDAYVWKPPEPLFVAAEKDKARKRKKKES